MNPALYTFLSALLILVAPGTADAHREEHPRDPVATHGGVAIRASNYNLELSRSGNTLVLHVYSKGNRPLATTSSHAEIRLPTIEGESLVSLEPAGGNKLHGTLGDNIETAGRAVLRLKLFAKPVVEATLDLSLLMSSSQSGQPFKESRGGAVRSKARQQPPLNPAAL